MQHWIHYPLAAVVAGLVGFASARLAPARASERAAEPGPSLAELARTLEELRTENARLAERLAALPAPVEVQTSRRAPPQDLDAAIAAFMAREFEAGASDGTLTLAAGGASDSEAAAIAERILSGLVTGVELDALWQKLREEKRIDAVVAEIERAAGSAPSNPDLQTELGRAYLQKLFDVGVGPMAGVWGNKADQAFDQALALDPGHWEARFDKAVALSNWPAFLGKQDEAIRHFELALEHQERAAPRDDHALTYQFLGNLYDQTGDHEKALALWRRGATRFPDDETLRAKTEERR